MTTESLVCWTHGHGGHQGAEWRTIGVVAWTSRYSGRRPCRSAAGRKEKSQARCSYIKLMHQGRVIMNHPARSNFLPDSIADFVPSSNSGSATFCCWLTIASLWIALEATRGTLFPRRTVNGMALRSWHDQPAAISLFCNAVRSKRL